MALSNIGKEPRREITESAVGIVIFAGAMLLDYRFARWAEANTSPGVVPWPLGMIIGVLFAAVAFMSLAGVLYFTHAAGESFCDALARRGIELRPKQRYR